MLFLLSCANTYDQLAYDEEESYDLKVTRVWGERLKIEKYATLPQTPEATSSHASPCHPFLNHSKLANVSPSTIEITEITVRRN